MRPLMPVVLALVCCTGIVFARTDFNASTSFEKSIPFEPGGSLRLENENGHIDVRSWEKAEVRVFARIRANARDEDEAEALLKEVEIRVDVSGQHIDVYAEKPRRYFERNRYVSINFEVMVPEKIDLDVKTTNGGVEVDAITGTVEARTTNGGIDILRVNGAIRAQTTNGGIDAELVGFSGKDDLEFHTTNGSILVTLPKDIKGSIDAETTNGHIEVDFPVTIQGRISKTAVRGDLNGGGPVMINLHTTNGAIRVRDAF